MSQQPGRLQVGRADDALEHAADRAADAALARIAERHVHGPACGHAAEPAPVQRRATMGREGGTTTEDFTQRVETMRERGRELDDGVRRRMEHGFATSLTGVRIHTGPDAAEAAAEIGAAAFTTGRDIFFGAGQYRPGTPEGDHVIGHEIAHTLQQGTATRRISRLWDFAPRSMLNLHDKAAEVEPLDEARLVLKVTGHDGTPIVVKSEDQPIGLGQLLGKLQKSTSDVKTVKFRALHDHDVAQLIWVLKDDARAGRDAKWASFLDQSRAKNYAGIDGVDPATLDAGQKAQLGRKGAVGWLLDTLKSGSQAVAMSFAEGMGMDKQAEAGNAPAILDAPGHMRKLGKVTVMDILFRNRDRIGANAGNWMATADAKVTLIDNVDSAGNSMRNAWSTNTFVEGSDDIDKLAPSQLADTAGDYVERIISQLDAEGGGLPGGWRGFLDAQSPVDAARTRRELYAAEFEAGLREARERLIKTFSATRFSVTKKGRQARKDRQKIKAQAQAAHAVDSEREWHETGVYDSKTRTVSDKTTRMEVDYFEVLKSRVKQLKALR